MEIHKSDFNYVMEKKPQNHYMGIQNAIDRLFV